MADNNPKKSNRYFTKGGYYKIKRLLEERTERAEEWLKGYKKPLLAIGATALTFAGLTLVHKEQLGVTEAKEFSENQQYHMEIEREGNYVVTYINTNAYSEVPDYNKIERLVPGDIIEYAPAYVGRYVESDEMAGYWELDSENKNSQATKWDFCINRGTGNSGYVPDQYVTKFLPFQLSDGEQSVKYKSSPDLQYDGEIESDQYVYVNLEEMYEDSEGNQIFQIITRKTYDVLEDDTGKTQTKYEYTTGFMGIDGLKSVKNMDAIGVINNATFLREYPVVTELQNDIVIDLFQNGQRLSVTEAIEEGPETWYKCTIPGSSKVFYVASYAVKNVHEYDMQIEYSGDEAGEIVKAGNDENKYILQGDKVYIDTTTRSGDLVEVMVNGCTGYIDVKKLGLYYLSEEDISENPQNENGTNQTKKDSVSQNPVTQNDSVNNVQYIIDLSDFSHFEDYLKKVSELKSEGKLGGVIFEIGGTKLNENFTKKIIADRESDTQEYINNTNTNNVSLQKYYDDINSHFVANQRVTDTVMGNWEDFIKHVKTAVDSDIPVGFYYYSCAVNANEASAEAAYINAIYQKVYNEIPEFKNFDPVMEIL